MLQAARLISFTLIAAALTSACADVASPTQAASRPASALASKGSGGGGGGGTAITQLVVTTPPTVSAAGAWMGTSDGPDVTHTYTFRLSQSNEGIVSGSGTMATPFLTSSYNVVGTVNADTLMLYVGTTCSSCTLSPLYRGIVSSSGTRVDGNFLNGGISPVTLYKQ